MKKTLSIILALAMLFSFAALTACSKEEPNPADTSSGAESNPPAASEGQPAPVPETGNPGEAEADQPVYTKEINPDVIRAALDAGEEVVLGCTMNTLAPPALNEMVRRVGELAEEKGFTFSAVSADGNVATQIGQIENFTEMGVAAIFLAAVEADTVAPYVEAAQEKGIVISVLSIGSDLWTPDAGLNLVQEDVGKGCGEMVLAYLDYAYPGEDTVTIAWAQDKRLSDPTRCSNACLETLLADPRIEIGYKDEQNISIEDGVTFAEEVFTVNRDIRVFVVYNEASATGVDEYIKSQPGTVLSEYAVFCVGGSDALQAQIAETPYDEMTIRGTVSYGSDRAGQWFGATYDAVMGNAELPNMSPLDLWAVTSFGFEL